MEIKNFFQICSFEYKTKATEIKTPNNEQYEIRAEKFEERIAQIVIQKQKAYKDAEELLIY